MQHEMFQVLGDLKISKDVIATIAKTAALEIEGTAGFTSIASLGKNVGEWLFKKQPLRPVVVELRENIAEISLYMSVREGVHIPTLGQRVQAAVKEAVQSMTGITVAHVHINITDMVFDTGNN